MGETLSRFCLGRPVCVALLLALPTVSGCVSHGSAGDSHAAVGDSTGAVDPGAPRGATADVLIVHDSDLLSMGLASAAVERRAFHHEIRTTASVEFDLERVVDQTVRVGGWLERVNAYPQDRVRAGDTLALVYSPDYLVAQSNLLQARRQADAARAAGDSADLRTAAALVESSRQRLRLLGASERAVTRLLETGVTEPALAVVAPLSGTVAESDATRGAAVSPGDRLFRIADLSTVWLRIDLYERDLGYVHAGDRVTISVNAYPGANFHGRVTRIGGVLDTATRTVRARAAVANPDGRLKPGMFVTAIVQSTGSAGVAAAVPEAAVQQVGDDAMAFVRMGPGRYAVRHVVLGTREGGFFEVRSGVTVGEQVVTRGSFILKAELTKGSLEPDEP